MAPSRTSTSSTTTAAVVAPERLATVRGQVVALSEGISIETADHLHFPAEGKHLQFVVVNGSSVPLLADSVDALDRQRAEIEAASIDGAEVQILRDRQRQCQLRLLADARA